MNRNDLARRWSAARETLRSELWPLPTAGIVVALLSGLVLPVVDRRWDDGLPGGLQEVLFGGGPSAARTLLDAIASSLVTVTSLTFSLTVVTLQLASSQFSPRLLRTFTSDTFVKVTLALFLATFTFALTVLRSVRSEEDSDGGFVPALSVTVAFVLAVASVVALVLFLAHLARQIRVETMLARVRAESRAAVHRLARARDGAPPRESPPPGPVDAHVLGRASGFLTGVDLDRLVELTAAHDAVLELRWGPGAFAVGGTPIGHLWMAGEETAPTVAVPPELSDGINQAVTTGPERTQAQDVGFGLRQLVDVTLKALSPGINDPTTAVHALGHLSALLCELTDRELGPVVARDPTGVARVFLPRPEFGELLDLAVSQPRRYGAADPEVLGAILRLLQEVAWTADARPDVGSAVHGQLASTQRTVEAQDFDDQERDGLATLAAAVLRGLDGSRRGGPGV